VLVSACLRRLLAAASLPEVVRARAAAFAWATALLFAVHPLASEVVLYASQRSEGLVAVAYLGAIYLVIRAADGGGSGSFWPAALVGLLGAASKEVFVTAPVAALFLDRAFYAGSFARAWRLRWRLYLGLASCALAVGLLQLGDPRPDSVRFGELAYLLAQAKVVAGYFATAFWPSSLAIDHGPLPAAIDVQALAPFAAPMSLAVLGGGALAFRRPKLGYLAVWVFGILAPSSSLFSVHTEVGADRRFYLPLIGVIAYAVVGVGACLVRVPSGARRAVAIALTAAVASALGVTAQRHADTYASTRAIWEQVVRTYPENARGHYNLAETYRREGDLPAAAESFRATLERDPNYLDAHVNLGSTLVALGDLGEGVAHLRRAVALAPADAGAHYNLGIALGLSGQTSAALQQLERAVRLDPTHLEARRKLASAYLALGRKPEARTHAERILRLRPSDAFAAQVLRTARP
jgi:protein O-mannosyl-transferase